ncbi:hypothetical protein [Nannocystis radixulma]|uniref:Uncharacterized protein n=1 Tax=Nannocystis radixulma TaxID=2995305 RepID=A0ABT5BNH5_9BACT|nr:hypothetical protein [Nannocystis radixulma]MDC0674542.1 hypothetical protein [Nannocystis radixulma]
MRFTLEGELCQDLDFEFCNGWFIPTVRVDPWEKLDGNIRIEEFAPRTSLPVGERTGRGPFAAAGAPRRAGASVQSTPIGGEGSGLHATLARPRQRPRRLRALTAQ